jgi:hypothetical protein
MRHVPLWVDTSDSTDWKGFLCMVTQGLQKYHNMLAGTGPLAPVIRRASTLGGMNRQP